MNFFSKIWIVAIVVVVLAGGILTWQYFGMPKEEVKAPGEIVEKEFAEDKTADWSIYKNVEYNYQIKYPPALKPVARDDTPIERARIVIWTFPEEVFLPQVVKSIAIDVYENLADLRIESPALALKFFITEEGCKMEIEESAFAKMSCEADEEPMQVRTTFSAFAKNDTVYIIALAIMAIMSVEKLSDMDFSYELDIYDQMVSTFEFLE